LTDRGTGFALKRLELRIRRYQAPGGIEAAEHGARL
jgi:hypothetical protein